MGFHVLTYCVACVVVHDYLLFLIHHIPCVLFSINHQRDTAEYLVCIHQFTRYRVLPPVCVLLSIPEISICGVANVVIFGVCCPFMGFQ